MKSRKMHCLKGSNSILLRHPTSCFHSRKSPFKDLLWFHSKPIYTNIGYYQHFCINKVNKLKNVLVTHMTTRKNIIYDCIIGEWLNQI